MRLQFTSFSLFPYRLLLAGSVLLAAALATGCGGNSSQTTLTGNTTVTLLASSTANDQLSGFNISISSVALTTQSGTKVTLLATPQTVEFIHLNGSVQPLVTVSVPQAVYTAATVSVELNQATPVCVARNPATNGLLHNAAIGTMHSGATVNLPAPITVTGTSMALALNLQVSQSISSFDCISTPLGSASITPTFNLIPVTIAAQPTNSANGKVTGLHGVIGSSASSTSGFTLTGALNHTTDGPTWQVSTNSGTIFQGDVQSAAQLAAEMPVDMDAAIQPDGSLLATRVAVYDTTTSNLSFSTGPLAYVSALVPDNNTISLESHGPLYLNSGATFVVANAVFRTSAQLSNIQNLPFNASFNAANMVPGQNVFTTTHSTSYTGSNFPPATTVTLVPQTINGKVSAVSSSGGFTAYTVSLANYNLFSNLAVQPGQTTLLANPGSVVVYVDSNTQLLNTGSIAVGSTLRFNGLVFNDNGTLRMDCAQVSDGVTE